MLPTPKAALFVAVALLDAPYAELAVPEATAPPTAVLEPPDASLPLPIAVLKPLLAVLPKPIAVAYDALASAMKPTAVAFCCPVPLAPASAPWPIAVVPLLVNPFVPAMPPAAAPWPKAAELFPVAL